MCTEFLGINKGVPQETVLGSLLFSIMVNDISSVDSSKSVVIKYADDITLNVTVVNNNDASILEVKNIQQWAKNNSMKLNLKNTWEMVVKERTI